MNPPDAISYYWPDDLPSGCPPSDAQSAEGAFYRLVKNDPPSLDDFRRPRDLPRKRPILPEELCAYSAISLFGTIEDIQLARQYIPGFRKKKVALGELTPHMGVVLNSPQLLALATSDKVALESHTDWWMPKAFNACLEFRVVGL